MPGHEAAEEPARPRPPDLVERPPDPEDQQALPVQSSEDTDTAWGELPEPDEDERLYRDRPPHWDSR